MIARLIHRRRGSAQVRSPALGCSVERSAGTARTATESFLHRARDRNAFTAQATGTVTGRALLREEEIHQPSRSA